MNRFDFLKKVCKNFFLKKGKRLTFLCLKEKLQKKQTNVPLDRGDRQVSRMKMIWSPRYGAFQMAVSTPEINEFRGLLAAPIL